MTTKILMTSDCDIATAKDVCVFLANYAACLLASGATCIRLEKNVNRIAAAFGMEAVMAIMPRHIHMTVVDGCSGEILTSISTVPDAGINFAVNTELSRLSWEIADGKLNFRGAVEKYYGIIERKDHNKWLTMLLVALANASFCRLFGGDAVAMAVVGMATLCGYYIKICLVERKIDTRIIFMACAFISSVLGATDKLFSLGETPEIAIGTSVLYLVPGIPFLNSFSDLLYRRYVCAFARFFDAVILTCCLSTGLCAGMWLMDASMF